VEGGRAGGGTRSPSSRPAALTVVASLAPSAGRPGAPDAVGSPPSTADAGVSTPPAPPSATPSRRSPSAGGAPPPPPPPARRLRWQDDDGAEALASVREFEASDDEGEGEGGGGQPVCCALQ